MTSLTKYMLKKTVSLLPGWCAPGLYVSGTCIWARTTMSMGKWGYDEPNAKKQQIEFINCIYLHIDSKYMH